VASVPQLAIIAESKSASGAFVMATVAIVYHSGYGHTARVAEHVRLGVLRVEGVAAVLMSAEQPDWPALDAADAIILGAPTYMGSVSAAFKTFMDQTSRQWLNQAWKDKLAAGFTNSGGLSGDKLSVLFQLQIFSAQHGMLWVPLPLMPTGTGPDDINRMGSHLGLMTQSDNAPAELTPPAGDIRTAELFGAHVAERTLRWSCTG
jgi:NAD(P)H dehydrogenase (quinone)